VDRGIGKQASIDVKARKQNVFRHRLRDQSPRITSYNFLLPDVCRFASAPAQPKMAHDPLTRTCMVQNYGLLNTIELLYSTMPHVQDEPRK